MDRRRHGSDEDFQMPNISLNDFIDGLKTTLKVAYGAPWNIALDTRNGSYFKKTARAMYGPTTSGGEKLRNALPFSSLLFDPITSTGWETYDRHPGTPWHQTKNWFKSLVRPYRKDKVASGFFKEFFAPVRRVLWLGWNLVERVLMLAIGALGLAVAGIFLGLAAAIWAVGLAALPFGLVMALVAGVTKLFDALLGTNGAEGVWEFAKDCMKAGAVIWGISLVVGLVLAIASPFIAIAMALGLTNWVASEVVWAGLTLGNIVLSPLTTIKSIIRGAIVTPLRQTDSLSQDPKLLDLEQEGKAAVAALKKSKPGDSHGYMLDALYCAKKIHKRALEIRDIQERNGHVTTEDSRFCDSDFALFGHVSQNDEGVFSSFKGDSYHGTCVSDALLTACKANQENTLYDPQFATRNLTPPLENYFNHIAPSA